MAFHPYVNFAGNCREAFTRYQEIFGGELTLLSWEDMPGDEAPPTDKPELIMHAALAIGDALLMGSDADPDNFTGMHGAYVNFSTDDAALAERIYNALADGGQVHMPLGETFFSPRFGMCADRYGVNWMVNTWQAGQG
jgi:PhnB protein